NVWGIVLEEGSAEISKSLIRTSGKTGIAARKAQLSVKDSVITENSSGGFILEDSKVLIEQNNILNNGNWAVKVIDQAGKVQAAHNWWGDENPELAEIIGKLAIQPVLNKPIEFKIVE
ncbi:MAG: right-handed parallel beta-helix repeat-containing protein, partial [Desulfobacterales bacterium]|nr:right-handed parallel beta-helix repeat-containing protein [Desulfobacterales bacterium]